MEDFGTREAGAGPAEAQGWPIRPFLLAALGLATGLVFHWIAGDDYTTSISAGRTALLMGVTLGATLIGFTLERRLWWCSLIFSVAAAAVAALVTWSNGAPGGWSASEGWRTMSLLLAVAIAAPLFQAGRDKGAWRAPYSAVHDHGWANVMLWCASWLFVAIVWVMTWLLASLFQLIKIEVLHDLLMKEWFCQALVGLAFGGALGLLREHEAVVRVLRRVVMIVLGVLAPILAIGLALFLLALPFTGVKALWDATSATTPLLLSCAVGALILANAVIGNREEEERRTPLLRYAAMVLALVVLPLALLAAVATGLRVGQYGYTPERLWAIVFVGIAICVGAAYLGALLAGRMRWTRYVRPANLVLAYLLCALGLVLATPLISFNRISTRDQVARLESGRMPAAKFDWRALAFDFGKPGRDALAKLAAAKDPAIREKAAAALKGKSRFEVADAADAARADAIGQWLRVVPAGTALPADLRTAITQDYRCGRNGDRCTLVFLGEGKEAALLRDGCFAAAKPGSKPNSCAGNALLRYTDSFVRYILANGKWTEAPANDRTPSDDRSRAMQAEGYKAGQVEVRKVERRQLFIGGVALGDAFE